MKMKMKTNSPGTSKQHICCKNVKIYGVSVAIAKDERIRTDILIFTHMLRIEIYVAEAVVRYCPKNVHLKVKEIQFNQLTFPVLL